MGLLIHFAFALGLIILIVTAGLVRSLQRPRRKTYGVAVARGLATDPADLELDAVEATFRLTDGADTPGWVITGGDADGPAVILVHGFHDSKYGALTWAPLFVPFTSRIVVFDLSGQGESTSPNAHHGIREADDILAVMNQLEYPGPVVLFGYSFGASTAIAAAARDESQRIIGVIADAPYRYWSQPIANTLRKLRMPAQPFVALAWLWFRLTEPGFRPFDRCGDAAKLRCPLLVLHGTADDICPYEAGKAIAEAAPQGSLVTFEGGRHTQLALQDQTRYRDHLRMFFSALRNGADSGTIERLARELSSGHPKTGE